MKYMSIIISFVVALIVVGGSFYGNLYVRTKVLPQKVAEIKTKRLSEMRVNVIAEAERKVASGELMAAGPLLAQFYKDNVAISNIAAAHADAILDGLEKRGLISPP